MKQGPISIRPNADAGEQQLIQFGLPFPQGVYKPGNVRLCDAPEQALPAHLETRKLWPDGSLKWAFVNLLTKAMPELQVGLLPCESLNDDFPELVHEQETHLEIETCDVTYQLNSKKLAMFSAQTKHGHQLCLEQPWSLLDQHGNDCEGQVNSVSFTSKGEGDVPLLAEVVLQGDFIDVEGQSQARFEWKLEFHYHNNQVTHSFSLHNPKAAEHLGGTWDLGDKNSLLFKGLSLNAGILGNEQVICKDEIQGETLYQNSAPFKVYQESSGGKAWDSIAHVNRNGEVPQNIKGYRLEGNGASLGGERVQPVVILERDDCSWALSQPQFWQQCPSEIQVQKERVELALFPASYPDLHELQAGERKTLHFVMAFSSGSPITLSTKPAELKWSPDWLRQCQALPWFSPAVAEDAVQQVLSEGLYGEHSFLTKRERMDVYGWRHFGELYADHEAEGYEGQEPFVSFYNNQYDPVYGLLRQAFLREDSTCYQQAMELAQHVLDIDIYHTLQDKDEYNLGLFWHTDHYQKSETSTHRTYSKLHRNDAYEDHAGGGGPGGQHCYTTGLALTYWLTGNEQAKAAVLGLGHWIEKHYEGQGSLLEFLLAFKNRYRKDRKNLMTGRYPLDRGIGNYIIAMLDCYELSGEGRYLQKAAQLIQNTVHPADDISLRDFEDVEETWFYTVFFQAVARFLLVKTQLGEWDQHFLYARDSLLHYADWMVEHEELSLAHPERLEFPTLTWTAQDYRKVHVLYFASYFHPEHKADYREKADELYAAIIEGLQQDRTRTHTRVQAILMQNQGAKEWVSQVEPIQPPAIAEHGPAPQLSSVAQTTRLLGVGLKTLFTFSPRRELDQLRRRFPKVTKYIGPVHERD